MPESCQAAHAIGLDWLVITDHSCDLDDVDPDVSPQIRWDRLKADIANPDISPTTSFAVSWVKRSPCLAKEDNYVHMLAFGGMDKMVEGAFLPDQGGFMTEVFQESD